MYRILFLCNWIIPNPLNVLQYLMDLEITCPLCTGNTTMHGSYDRHVQNDDTVEWRIIYRVKCEAFGRTHAVIPDFIMPYKHYSVCERLKLPLVAGFKRHISKETDFSDNLLRLLEMEAPEGSLDRRGPHT
ncbi:MAG: DUF6431 domain-containing protein [Bacillota bacterium]